MLDENGYRYNVGIIIINDRKQVFWAKRNGKDAWQFPQGGIKKGESIELAMYRELKEETGIGNADVEILGRTKTWHYYDVPKNLIKKKIVLFTRANDKFGSSCVLMVLIQI